MVKAYEVNFFSEKNIRIGVFEAIATYNEGNIVRYLILQRLGIPSGANCIKTMKCVDALQIRKVVKATDEIEKSARRRLCSKEMEEEDDPDNPSWSWNVLKVGHKICFS